MGGIFAVETLEFFSYCLFEFVGFNFAGGEEFGVGESVEGVEEGVFLRAREEEGMHAGFGVEVVDCYEGGVVGDDSGGGVRGGVLDVGS